MITNEMANAKSATNLVLGALVLGLTLIGTGAWWIAAHPQEVRILIDEFQNQRTVKRVAIRYRRQIEFLVQRFQPGGAFGLSFTVGLAVLALSVWVFGGVLEDVLSHEEIALFDAPIVNYIAAHRLDWLTKAMEVTTYVGGGTFLIAVSVIGGLVLRYRNNSWHPFWLLAAAALGAVALDLAAKFIISRPRPPVTLMAAPITGWAFPSAHSAESTAVYGALAYLLSQTQKDWKVKVSSLAFAVVIAFLTGVSRVYLGVHWPTDVMAGWALGSAWLAIVFTSASIIEKSAGRT